MVREMGLEPKSLIAKSTAALAFFVFRSSFRSSFRGEVEKGLEQKALILNVFLAYLGVDLSHGGYIRPSAGSHCDFFRDTQVVCQGSEGPPETVYTDCWKSFLLADPVHRLPDLIWVARINQGVALIGGQHGFPQLGQDERYGSTGGCVLILLALNQGIVTPLHGGSVDVDAVIVQVYIFPMKGQNLRTAEAGQGQEGCYLTAFTFDGCQEYRDLLGGQEGQFVWHDLR